MTTLTWDPTVPAEEQLRSWCEVVDRPGIVRLVFAGGSGTDDLAWATLEPWIRSRAVTIADVRTSPTHAARDVAWCCDLVYLRPGVELRIPPGAPSPGLLWALGRAGRAALARGLLGDEPIGGAEAVRLGLAQQVVDAEGSLPVADEASLVAMTTARDLMRSSVPARSSLELASFRLLFASGDPSEGANAFLDRRPPEFGDPVP